MLSGIVGAFFKPLALTMAVTLVVSFFIALLVVPVVASWLAPAGRARRSGGRPVGPAWWPLRRVGSWYTWVVQVFVARGMTAVLAVVVLLATAGFLYGRIGTDFLPSMDEGSIILDYWTPPGTSLAETDEMLNQAERVIASLPDVASYSRRVGTQLGFFITEPNQGDYVIKLKPRGHRRDVDAVIEALRTRIAAVEPAIHTDFGQLLEDEIGDLTGGEPQPVDIKLFGDDADLLQLKAREVARAIAKVPGIEDVFDGIVIAGPALQVEVNAVAAARFGLTTEQVHAAVEPAVTGTVVDQMQIGERMYNLRVFAAPAEFLESLKLRAPGASGLVPLSTVATVVTGAPEAEIHRENLKTFVGVTARLSGRDLGSTMADVRRILAQGGVPAPGITVRYGGLFEQQQQSSFAGPPDRRPPGRASGGSRSSCLRVRRLACADCHRSVRGNSPCLPGSFGALFSNRADAQYIELSSESS